MRVDVSDLAEFLECVRRYQHIGYGHMIQIIAYEWSEIDPDRAVMELAPKDLHPELIEGLFNSKAAHPLAPMWQNYGERGAGVEEE